MRAVLDANVLISALLSRRGAPAALLLAWQEGAFELVVSPGLFAEVERALQHPKLARLVPAADAAAYVEWLRRSATVPPDPTAPPRFRSTDAGDDYLIALAAAARAVLVSGDSDLTALADRIPVRSARAFLEELTSAG